MGASDEGEFCDVCAVGPLSPWSAPDDQWNAVTEHPGSGLAGGRGAILCVACFADAASRLYGMGIVARVELHQKLCVAHGYWPPCPNHSTYDPCRWEPSRAKFDRRFEAAVLDWRMGDEVTE